MSLKERLARYLRNNHGWIASGDLQRIVADKTSYSPQNVGRRLRELKNDGVLEVQIRKGHAYYRVAEKQLSLLD
jgi:DNA-binding transcriptional ArsR family regulator